MSTDTLLRVEGLSVHAGTQRLIGEVSFQLQRGEALVLIGESGAGKSLIAQAIMGHLPSPLHARGRVRLGAQDSDAARPDTRRSWWGRQLALLPQEPALALDPLRSIGAQMHETLRLVAGQAPRQAAELTAQRLQACGLGDAIDLRPQQLSGGMAQRAGAAIALAGGAQVLLADEPTKGLDAGWVRHTLATFEAVRRAGGCVVVITHDLRVARALGGQLIVLQGGEVVEQGPCEALLNAPQHAFTQRLLAADPSHWPTRVSPPTRDPDWVLRAEGIGAHAGPQCLFEGVHLSLHRGQRIAVQGPSGSGKSTLGRVLLGLQAPTSGRVHRAAGLGPTACQKLYQDPAASFPPSVSLRQMLGDVAARHRLAWPRVQAWLAELRVDEALLQRRPAQVSGGELQRIAIARALCAQPAFLFADEPTSRLDALTQQETVQALLKAVDEADAALMWVTHDDDIARAVADVRWRL